MHIIHFYMSEALIYALGWTVVHSLWQAVGVALLLSALLHLSKNKSAHIRYWAAYGALFLVFGLAAVTFTNLYASTWSSPSTEITRLTMLDAPHAPVANETTLLHYWWQYFEFHLPAFVLLWLLGAVFFMLRLLGGLAYIERLKTAHALPLNGHWEDLLADLAQRMSIPHSIALFESAWVQTPMVIGHLKPLIFLPIGVVNQLSVEQVETVLAHELAHIGRHDYLLNVLQSLVEALLYFNPAVWWMSAVIRAEREHCCDDLALQVCNNPLAYAKALVVIQEMGLNAPKLAMTFGRRKKPLLLRIQRILQLSQNKTDVMEKITATFLLLTAVIGLSVGATQPSAQDTFHSDLVVRDTVPDKSVWNFNGNHGSKRVELKVKNNKIAYLKVDGREIPAHEYPRYQSMVEGIMKNIPSPPPMPPVPPAPPVPGLFRSDGDYDEGEIAELKAQAEAVAEKEARRWFEESEVQRFIAEAELLRVEAEQIRREVEQYRIEVEKNRRQAEEYRASSDRICAAKEKIEEDMLREGLINNRDNYQLELYQDHVLLNGKELPEQLARRYRAIYEEISKQSLEDRSSIIKGQSKTKQE